MLLAIDIGGTKIDVCTYTEDFQLCTHRVLETRDYRIRSLDFVEDLKSIFSANLTSDVERLGFSLNGSLVDGRVVFSSLLGGFVNYPIEEELSRCFGLPVQADDDLHSLAFAEANLGEGKGCQSFALVNLGTGFGVACYEGQVLRGVGNNAGLACLQKIYVEEFGEYLMADDVVCGGGIAKMYERLSGIPASAKEVFQRLSEDLQAQSTLEIFCKYLAQYLVMVSHFYNPQKIIIQGSLRKAADQYLPKTLEIYNREIFEIFRATEVIPSSLDHAACLGVLLDRNK